MRLISIALLEKIKKLENENFKYEITKGQNSNNIKQAKSFLKPVFINPKIQEY